MKCLKGAELRDYCKKWLAERHIETPRDIADKFHEACMKWDLRVVLLVGLKGTGKTTLMMQEILRIGDFDRTLFIQCDEGDYDAMDAFEEIVDANQDRKFIFASEVTIMKDFIPKSSLFSDVCIFSRYIFSGTDSFCLTLATEDELYDRNHTFQMLPLFYPEAHRVFHQEFEDYLRYGGRMENGKAIYASMASFRETDERVISDNLVHSLDPEKDRYRRASSYSKVRRAVAGNRMPDYLEKALLRCNQPFMKQVVEDALASLPLASSADKAWEKDVRSCITTVFEDWRIKNDPDKLWETHRTDDAKECLANLCIIQWWRSMLDDSENIKFYQPGLRYCLSLEMMRQLKESGALWMKYDGMLDLFWDAVEKTARRNVLQELVLFQLEANPIIRDSYEIQGYRRHWKKGPDFLLHKKTEARGVFLWDIRATKTCRPESDGTEERMNDPEACKHIERWSGGKILGKIVLYLGKDTFCKNGICYLHVGGFLCHSQEKLQEAVRHYQSSLE